MLALRTFTLLWNTMVWRKIHRWVSKDTDKIKQLFQTISSSSFLTLDFFFRVFGTPTSATDTLSLSSPAPLETSWLLRSGCMATGGAVCGWTISWPGLGKTCRRQRSNISLLTRKNKKEKMLNIKHNLLIQLIIPFIYPEMTASLSTAIKSLKRA